VPHLNLGSCLQATSVPRKEYFIPKVFDFLFSWCQGGGGLPP